VTRRVVCIGGSDAGITAALRAREFDPDSEVTVILADAYPNFSICGIPYLVSGEVGDWRDLAHRSADDLEAAGIRLRPNTLAHAVDAHAHRITVSPVGWPDEVVPYDQLIVATGAEPDVPPIDGLRGSPGLSAADGVHLLHTMTDAQRVVKSIEERRPSTALIVGAGYIGLEMADALTLRGIQVTLVEALPQVLPTVDAELATLVNAELLGHGVRVLTGTKVTSIKRHGDQLQVAGDHDLAQIADMVVVVVGVQPDGRLAELAGARLGARGSIMVDDHMRTGVPDVFAAGDCVHTHHRLLTKPAYLPLGTTAHKQGRVAGENAVGGDRVFAGSVGTQVVKVFDLAIARTGLRDHEAVDAGYLPLTVDSQANDHKAYYPGAHAISLRVTGDRNTGLLLGMQLVGHRDASIAKRVDIAAAALFAGLTVDQVSDLDLAYTPPLGSPWDAVQAATQTWSVALARESASADLAHLWHAASNSATAKPAATP
jgi:NADPH-dependent 2,4-dienoyl-CoA reductase/sulfur reductase-like enzyme